jgi:branched-chain amino acid transport system permease protein
METSLLWAILINGIALGGLYALISIGLNVIFGVMDFVNFAHGEYIMLSMYGTFFIYQYTGLHPFLALAIMIPVMFIIGVVTQRIIFQPVIDAPGTMQIFVSLGLLLILQNAALLAFGGQTRSMSLAWSDQTVNIFGAIISYPRLAALFLSIGTTIVFFALLRYTHIGRIIRATAQEADGAELMGVNTKTIYMITFGIGLALVAIASAPLTMIYFITPTIGVQFVLIAFVVVVLGGLGNLKGALYAGFFIGILEATLTLYYSSEFAITTYFVLFIVVLYVRSQFGSIRNFLATASGGIAQ